MAHTIATAPVVVDATILLKVLPSYVPYFLGLIKIGSMSWYVVDGTVVGGRVVSMDIKIHPILADVEEIWFSFEEPSETIRTAGELFEGGVV